MNCVKEREQLPIDIKDKLDGANFYYTEAYENYTHQRNEKIYFFWDDKFVISLRVKTVFMIRGGVFDTEPFKISNEANEKDEQYFIDEVCSNLKNEGVQWVVCAQTSSFTVYPNGSKTVPKGNLIVDLKLTEDELFQKVHSKHRNSIRRAERSEVQIARSGENIVEDYKSIEEQTWERSNRSGTDLRYYKRIAECLPNNADIVVAYKDGKPQAGGVFFYNKEMSYYLHGSTKNNPEPGAANLLLWDEMIKLKREGVKKFNFVGYRLNPEEGSKLYGIQHFKERFGGTLYKSYNFRYVSNNLAYKMYCLAMQLKSSNKTVSYHDAIDEQIDKYPEYNRGS